MIPWTDKTLWKSLSEVRAAHPHGLAILYADQKLTYEDFVRRVERFAVGLLKLGVRKGDKVSIWCGNRPEWLIAKFAITSLGAVVVPINTRFKTNELEYVLVNSDSTTILLGDSLLNTDFMAIMRQVLPEIEYQEAGKIASERFPFLRNVIGLSRCEHKGVFSYPWVEDSGDDPERQTELEGLRAQVTVDDVANILYTSGTTGLPKGVMLSHRLLSNAFYVGEELRLTPDDRLLLYLPFNHCFGLHNGVCGGVTHGSTIVLMDYFDAEASLKLIERHRVTILFGVPTMYLMQIHHPRFATYDISSLRTGMIGGAGAPPSMIQEIMNAMGITLISTYGMTETSCAVTQTRYRDSAEVISQTVGQTLPHLEMKVIGKDKSLLGPYAEGEICIRGPSVTSGYYKNWEETRKLIDEKGWVHSGDLGTFNEEGYYRITGRLKDLIIRGGENIAPSEIENFLYQHPDIQQVQVVGVPDEKLGEAVAAFVIPRPGRSLTAEDIIGFCRGKIASFKIPSVVRFVSEFPTTASGKIKKFELRELVKGKILIGE
jgi:fatty-acyl-CoA synthase